MDLRDDIRPHHVLSPTANQDLMYSTIAGPVLDKLSLGYSTSIVAYGQTGSGKVRTRLEEDDLRRLAEEGSVI